MVYDESVTAFTRKLCREVITLADTQVLGEGKTVEEAIENALGKIELTAEQVKIEVIEEPSRGFLGLRPGKAIVRLTRKNIPEKAIAPTLTGVVSVKDGRLEYIPPVEGNEVAATIRFGGEFRVLYHGAERTKEVQLTEGLGPLEMHLPEKVEPELHYELVVDQKGIEARLLWKRTPGVSYHLMDRQPTNSLQLSLTKTILDAPTLTRKAVEELVRVEGLAYGLQMDDLTEEALAAPQGSFLLALGREPGPTRHPSIKYVFQDDAISIDDQALRIDHYEVHGTSGVNEGAILATKDPGELGKPGVDVYGKPILGEACKTVELLVGEGARLSEDGLQAIATISGLPSLQSGVVRVTNVFELAGDADVSTGNITMDGAIIIRGNVLENVKVQSTNGAIVVNGLVSGGALRSGGSITVLRNAVRAQIYAGGISVTNIRLVNLLRSISGQLEALQVAYDAIVSQADNIPFENLIRHLIELKFSALPKDSQELANEVEQIRKEATDQGDAYTALVETIDSCLLIQGPGPLKINEPQELLHLRQEIKARINELEGQRSAEADVKVGYLQNSDVEASGMVEVTGKGCFYSTVLAGSGFKIAGGVFRGGQVVVNSGSIIAKELGGPKGIATAARVLQTGNISATLVHPNVTVEIRSQSYKFDETASMVKVYFQDNILTVYSGSNKIHG